MRKLFAFLMLIMLLEKVMHPTIYLFPFSWLTTFLKKSFFHPQKEEYLSSYSQQFTLSYI